MRGLIAWFVKNPVAANLLMVAMFVSGIFGYNSLEREFIPGTTVNGMTVSVVWNGASPRDVNEQIVTRVEEAVDGLDGIDYVEATARACLKNQHSSSETKDHLQMFRTLTAIAILLSSSAPLFSADDGDRAVCNFCHAGS